MSTPPEPRPESSAPAAGPGDEVASRPPTRRRLLLLVALAALALDALSKAIVVAALSERAPIELLGGLVYLTEARNTGAAFSFAPGATMVFTIVAILVIVLILRTSSRVRSLGWAIALGLILGGATGNLSDRLLRSPGPLRGAVIDFLSVLDPYGGIYPIFNLADSSIVCGGVLAVLLAFRGVDLDATRTRHGS